MLLMSVPGFLGSEPQARVMLEQLSPRGNILGIGFDSFLQLLRLFNRDGAGSWICWHGRARKVSTAANQGQRGDGAERDPAERNGAKDTRG
jgi:hypothetical protein